MSFIEDPSNGNTIGVTDSNRGKINSITATVQEIGIANGNGYNLATSRITLIGTTESAVFFFRNGENIDVEITSIFINTTNSQGTLVGAQPTLKIYRNPRAGTIITNATPILVSSNNNFGSRDELIGDAYQGTDGATLDSESITVIDVPLPTRQALPLVEFPIEVVLPRGASIGLSYQPEDGSTSVDVIAGLTLVRLPQEF